MLSLVIHAEYEGGDIAEIIHNPLKELQKVEL